VRDCVSSRRAKLSVREGSSGRTILAVAHSVSRGTKRAIDDAIYEAGLSNLGSTHRDFDVGVAHDLSVIDRPLSKSALERLSERAAELAGEEGAVRAIRQIEVPEAGW
jgi:D-3-phosphoglycerate dehydrogenase